MNRENLAEKLELIGSVFEIEGLTGKLEKLHQGMDSVAFNAVVIQVAGLLLKENPEAADKLVRMSLDISEKDVEKMDEGTYATALKGALIKDVLGFFGSSPRSDGKK